MIDNFKRIVKEDFKESFDDDRKRYFFFPTYGIYVTIYIQKTKEQIENADAENLTQGFECVGVSAI